KIYGAEETDAGDEGEQGGDAQVFAFEHPEVDDWAFDLEFPVEEEGQGRGGDDGEDNYIVGAEPVVGLTPFEYRLKRPDPDCEEQDTCPVDAAGRGLVGGFAEEAAADEGYGDADGYVDVEYPGPGIVLGDIAAEGG